jgi:hypothetical protein
MFNWFKFFIILAVYIYLGLFAFEQYRLTKAHNLDVTQAIVSTCKIFNGDSNAVEKCGEKIKSNYIFKD